MYEAIAKQKILTDAEFARLLTAYHAGDLEARNSLVERNVRLAIMVATRSKLSLPFEDRVQEAVKGIVRAVEKFDPALGIKFSTYATLWAQQAISRAYAKQSGLIRIPERTAELRRDVDAVAEEHFKVCGEELTDDDVAEQLELSAVRRERLAGSAINAVAIEDVAEPADLDSPEDMMQAREHHAIIQRLLAALSEDERFVVCATFGLNGVPETTQGAIAEALGCKRRQVAPLMDTALTKLRGSEHAGLLRGLLN